MGRKSDKEKFLLFHQTPKDCMLQLHSTSPANVSSRSISTLLKRVVEDHFGDMASGTVGHLIIIKYFSNKTSTGIIRCSRTDFHLVMAAPSVGYEIENLNVVMRCVHVSGTIRKCEEFSIRRSRQLMIQMGKEENLADHEDFLLNFGIDKDDDE